MLAALSRPLSPARLVLGTAGILGAVAVYCLAYTSLAGQPESLGEAISWGVIHIAPWCFGFEALKRARTLLQWGAALLLAFASSLALGWLLGGPTDLGFEAVRRLPAAMLVVLLAAFLRILSARTDGPTTGAAPIETILAPEQIDWVAAAGNYVEIRGGGRTVVRRASLASVERQLRSHGFVRIHRSLLVRRDRIARIRQDDVVLHDGTSLKLGSRYRAALRA